MNIDSIHNGIVLDHIQAGKAMDIYRFLGLDALDCSVAIIKNAPSRKMGRKDIIKIDSEMALDLNILGFIDPSITVNTIKDGQLVRKEHLRLPDRITNVLRCKNPRCIVTVEQELPHVFKLTDPKKAIYRCLYCETKAEV